MRSKELQSIAHSSQAQEEAQLCLATLTFFPDARGKPEAGGSVCQDCQHSDSMGQLLGEPGSPWHQVVQEEARDFHFL